VVRYAYTLHESVAAALLAARKAGRSELLRFMDALANAPSRREAEAVLDELGRRNEVAYVGHFRVVYWADHAAKEIRIMDIRQY
jgi:hypothetical protein